jgi:hypothetical protein
MRNKLIGISLVVLAMVSFVACKKDYIYGDITPNTDRVMVEFTDSKNNGQLSLSYGTQMVSTTLTELRFNPRSSVSQDAQVKYTFKKFIDCGLQFCEWNGIPSASRRFIYNRNRSIDIDEFGKKKGDSP